MSISSLSGNVDTFGEILLQSSDLSLETLVSMIRRSTIDIAPDFQRRDRWTPGKQSSLIESFLINIPVPPVYLAEESLGNYSVIDGRQRLSAVRDFVVGDLRLRGMTKLHDYEGKYAQDLPQRVIANLLMRPLRTVTLMRQSDPWAKYEVFHRLNTGGESLNAQEVRNVAFRGAMNTLLLSLSENSFLRDRLKITGPKSPSYKSMKDVEYVLRFFALRSAWNTFSGDLSHELDKFMILNQHPDRHDLDHLRGRFERALDWAEYLFQNHAFQRPEGLGWRDQTLAGLYDAEMIAIDLATDASLQRLGAGGGLEVVRQLFADSTFDSAVRTGTNTSSKVRFRINATLHALTES